MEDLEYKFNELMLQPPYNRADLHYVIIDANHKLRFSSWHEEAKDDEEKILLFFNR